MNGRNATRAVIRDAIPEECLAFPGKFYNDEEVGRGARNDKFLDKEGQGFVNLPEEISGSLMVRVENLGELQPLFGFQE